MLHTGEAEAVGNFANALVRKRDPSVCDPDVRAELSWGYAEARLEMPEKRGFAHARGPREFGRRPSAGQIGRNAGHGCVETSVGYIAASLDKHGASLSLQHQQHQFLMRHVDARIPELGRRIAVEGEQLAYLIADLRCVPEMRERLPVERKIFLRASGPAARIDPMDQVVNHRPINLYAETFNGVEFVGIGKIYFKADTGRDKH